MSPDRLLRRPSLTKAEIEAEIARAKAIRLALFERQSGLCFYCFCKIILPTDTQTHANTATIDHIKPRLGPEYRRDHSPTNLVLSCRDCNFLKADIARRTRSRTR